jgi:hypothetical protein
VTPARIGGQGVLMTGVHARLLRLRTAIAQSLARKAFAANPWTPQCAG